MHRDCIIIGGGLSGLVAAYALQQHKLSTTLIEVKRRVGGAIQSVEQNGFICDSGQMAFAPLDHPAARDLLERIQLAPEQALFALETGGVAFRQGTQALIEALNQQLSVPRLMRMAVSSIGELSDAPDGRIGICLENGLMLTCERLIMAVPAPHAARLIASYDDSVARHLFGFRYDALQRLTLGYRQGVRPLSLSDLPEDMSYVSVHSARAQRTPSPEGVLMQLNLRLDPRRATGERLLQEVLHQLRLPAPEVWHVGTWATSDATSPFEDDFLERLVQIRRFLPPRIALVGDDYHGFARPRADLPRLDGRIAWAWQETHRLIHRS